MHQNIQNLVEVASKPERMVIGLMSGTSMDGLDIALCLIKGSGRDTKFELKGFTTIDYTNDFKDKILSIFSKEMVALETLCLLNAWVGRQHGKMVLDALASWNIAPEKVDIIASHGQSIYHAPKSLHPNSEYDPATLQIGDGDHIAVTTGILTLSDFRQKHVAAGGEGAPLAVYGDYLLCSHPTENRLLLNMGGIANFTYLAAGCSLDQVFSTDTGTGNTLMDAYIRKHIAPLAYDKDGAIAASGKINTTLLSELKAHSFFGLTLPKTIGPELFNVEFLAKAQAVSQTLELSPEDVMATLNRFSAETIADCINSSITAGTTFNMYSSGGGMHNPVLMAHLKSLLPNANLYSSEVLGIHPDAKEAILFALLANEAVAGTPLFAGGHATKIPITMGKISFPL
ncbi:MAG: anhydro-N-acetylmuramic acid kinase [Chitinophagia bacterium]